MKKKTLKSRDRDVINSFLHRTSRSRKIRRIAKIDTGLKNETSWLENWIRQGLDTKITRKGYVEITLPRAMNFSTNYEETMRYVSALKILSRHGASKNRKKLKLKRLHFHNLMAISSSAALVLTAEIARWQDHLPHNLTPNTATWDADILARFRDLGFFDLLNDSQDVAQKNSTSSSIRTVKYIRGSCNKKDHDLKEKMLGIIGREKIKKWPILSSGLDEAITNVGHHAYPDGYNLGDGNKYWYLTGAFNSRTNEMKVVFYDQGVGIPKSLPSSKLWERILEYTKALPSVGGRYDAALIKGAMEVSRTRTGSGDRGKGLRDLLDFIKERGEGYLSVISGRGLYKYEIFNSEERKKTERFPIPLEGTLIIWKVCLETEVHS